MTVTWPTTLVPAQLLVSQRAFTRSGGKSLGGIERTTRTDRGDWAIGYRGLALHSAASRRMFNSVRTSLSGRAGTLILPVWSFDVNGASSGISVTMAEDAFTGDTSVVLNIGGGITDLSGVRFSYQNAMYETGVALDVDEYEIEWSVPIFPALRADIAATTALEFNLPKCLVHLATDSEMDFSLTAGQFDRVDVDFVEAVDVWNDEAEGGS